MMNSRFKKVTLRSAHKFEISQIYSLEEAVALVPWMQKTLSVVQLDLKEQYDAILLLKRMYASEYAESGVRESELESLLEGKVHAFEASWEKWHRRFSDQGLFLRDVQEGAVNIPYKTRGGELLFLLWNEGDEGIFYFHEPQEGHSARRPILLLPE